MDATSMTFEDDRFDLAVDKGTLDAMMSAGDQEHTLAGAPWSLCRFFFEWGNKHEKMRDGLYR